MTSTKPVVIVICKLPEVIEVWMWEFFDIYLNETDVLMLEVVLVVAMQSADVLVFTITDYISVEFIV